MEMSRRLKKHLYLLLGCLFTPLDLGAAYASSGAGHGDYILTRLLYPFPVFFMAALGRLAGGLAPFIALYIVQLPVYGLIIDMGKRKEKQAGAVFGLMVFHMFFALVVFTVLASAFE